MLSHLSTSALLISAARAYVIVVGSSGGSTSLTYGSSDCASGAFTPVYDFINHTAEAAAGIATNVTGSKRYIYDDEDYYVRPHGNKSRNEYKYNTEPILWSFDIYDAYFNGSFSLTLEPDPNNSTVSNCPKFSGTDIPDGFLRIGPQTRGNKSRSSFDPNPFYLEFGRTIKEKECPRTEGKLAAAIQSSSDDLAFGHPWELQAKKEGSKFEVSGSLTTEKATWGNYYNYLVNTTRPEYASLKTQKICPTHLRQRTLTSHHKPTLTATIEGTKATLSWTITDSQIGYIIRGSFEGTIWKDGAQLDMAASTITTTGESKRVGGSEKKGGPPTLMIIAICVGIVVVIGALWVVWSCCSCAFACCACCGGAIARKRANKKQGKYAKAVQVEPKHDQWDQHPQQYNQQSGHMPYASDYPTNTSAPPAWTPAPQPQQRQQGSGQFDSMIADHQRDLAAAEAALAAAQKAGNLAEIDNQSALVRHHQAAINHFKIIQASGIQI